MSSTWVVPTDDAHRKQHESQRCASHGGKLDVRPASGLERATLRPCGTCVQSQGSIRRRAAARAVTMLAKKLASDGGA